MNTRLVLGSLAFLTATVLATACASTDDNAGKNDDNEVISTHNETASTFGLTTHEIALTLDDGPGPRTIEIAEWLAKEKIPAAFFMIGKSAKANPTAVQRVAQLSQQNNGLFIIGNHSMTHPLSLVKLGEAGALAELMDADAVLEDAIAASQKTYPSAISFFRPPGGSFIALGAANIATINATAAGKYQGPVFWDIGGALANGYSADWDCWAHKVSVGSCMDGYEREATAHGRGVMLAHDIHSQSVDMLIGTGAAGGRSFIHEMQAKGFKFVSMRAHEPSSAVGLVSSSSIESSATSSALANGSDPEGTLDPQ